MGTAGCICSIEAVCITELAHSGFQSLIESILWASLEARGAFYQCIGSKISLSTENGTLNSEHSSLILENPEFISHCQDCFLFKPCFLTHFSSGLMLYFVIQLLV